MIFILPKILQNKVDIINNDIVIREGVTLTAEEEKLYKYVKTDYESKIIDEKFYNDFLNRPKLAVKEDNEMDAELTNLFANYYKECEKIEIEAKEKGIWVYGGLDTNQYLFKEARNRVKKEEKRIKEKYGK